MVITHPPKNCSSENFYNFPIGRLMIFLTDKMTSYGISFKRKDKIPQYKWDNDIIYMAGSHYEDDVYKLCFKIDSISHSQASLITSIFCCHNDYTNTDINDSIIAPKEWVDYLTFQTHIGDNIILDDVIGGRIIVQIRLSGAYMLILDEKINKILC